ncbi:NAD(P)/FAD-dependent oxidoreductase [Amycolatopsis deserti]|uniref:NAD(P)/FAD-dependent oxidoreductase n=1 Tax=Amycolatopsis deserti TaxID=185696 RepID=UPI0027E4A36A|nr:FAD-binding oxidoreductase [Amycolatopsis deserti]
MLGGGLGGMAAALRLAELGHDVILVEADVCGWGASARNAGYVTGTVGSDPRILSRFYPDRAAGLFRFARNAVTHTEKLIASQDIDCGYRQTGVFSAAPTAAGFRRVRATTKSGKRSTVATADQAGIPPAFHGGVHVHVGGILNPGEFALGVRDLVRASTIRVFEQTPVQHVADTGDSVEIAVPGGRIRAERAILTTNAFTNQLEIAPRRLSTPVWVTAVETEPVPPEMLDDAGWTSRVPIVTTHLLMQSFRTTDRNTIVFSTRKLQMSRHPKADRLPDRAVVDDLVRGFRERFPTLGDISPRRAWGGWIGMTPANLAVAGQATPRVAYSMACNGHGLPQAPYLATLLADHLAGEAMHDDLRTVWRESPRFAPGVVNPATIRLGWLADRLTDRLGRLRR